VLAASHKFSAPKATSSDPCKHCGKFIHTSYNCFSKHPEKLAEYRARRAARASRGSGIGPSSKGSVSVAAASPAIAPSSSWVLDSGASFHVTSDKSQLAFSTPVIDGTSVQIADGTSCPITHQGSLCNSYFSVLDVSFVPQLCINLLSVGQIADQNCFVGFDDVGDATFARRQRHSTASKEAERNGEANCEGEEDAPEGPRAKGGECRQFPSEGKRRGCTPWRRDVRGSGSESPFDKAAKTLIAKGLEERQAHYHKSVRNVMSSCNSTTLCRL